jgi:hypothetical protein
MGVHKPPTFYLVVTFFPTYLPIYAIYFTQNWLPWLKPNMNSVEVHPQLSNNRLPVDGALVGAGSLWPFKRCVMNVSHKLNWVTKITLCWPCLTKAKILC